MTLQPSRNFAPASSVTSSALGRRASTHSGAAREAAADFGRSTAVRRSRARMKPRLHRTATLERIDSRPSNDGARRGPGRRPARRSTLAMYRYRNAIGMPCGLKCSAVPENLHRCAHPCFFCIARSIFSTLSGGASMKRSSGSWRCGERVVRPISTGAAACVESWASKPR